ncbi:MAG TPA: S53 family peptidase [Candidatus Sulfotelmatobacter sp.]
MNQKMDAPHAAADRRRWQTIWLYVVVATLIAGVALPASAAGKFVAHNTPRYVATAKNLGTENPSNTIEVSIWLNLHNRAEFDALARRLYDNKSADYRHFLNRAQIAARFAPTADEAKTVRQFFEAHNLKVVKTGPDNFFVRARGTVGDVEKAFHVVLNKYQVRNKIIRANDRDPFVDGAAAPLVMTVSGLDSGNYEHPMVAQSAKFSKGKPAAIANAAAGTAAPDLGYSNNCFDGIVTRTFSNNNDGSLPIGTYKGNHLNLFGLTTPGCGYTPPMIQAAYNLTGLYAEGFDGTGQTIGIIDWCGSLTIQNDANAFSTQFGLPQLTSSNFAITYIPRPSTCQAADQVEINIDVEWAHAIAPGANINLIVPPSASFQDVDQAEFTAVNYGLANVISGSYGSPESFTPATVLATENLINEIAAVQGISANFSSGDAGDFTFDGIPATVSAPADSPWATAVGGVTLALNSDNSIAWQSGWGNNQTLLAETGAVFDPPLAFGFIGGAGGGPSNCSSQDSSGNCLAGFSKPSYQKTLPGKYRQLPDVSWLADPYTGAVIAITIPGQNPSLVYQVWGGTSVACPMFAALWAIANQEAGAPLGQAAPYLYSLPSGAVYDIVPVGSKTNVTASIQESTMTNKYSASQVIGGTTPVAPGKYVSALWDYAFLQDTELVISFGTDCSAVPGGGFFGTPCNSPTALHTKVGWDNVTGVGTPNAKAFADSFHP